VQEAKPDPIPPHELELYVLAIVLILVLMLSLFKAFSYLEQELIPVQQLMVHSGQMHIDVVWQQGQRVSTIDNVEWCRPQ
jgi:hypothetical protein